MVSRRTRSSVRSLRACDLIDARRIEFSESSSATEAPKCSPKDVSSWWIVRGLRKRILTDARRKSSPTLP